MKAIINFLNNFSECVRFANEYRYDGEDINYFNK